MLKVKKSQKKYILLRTLRIVLTRENFSQKNPPLEIERLDKLSMLKVGAVMCFFLLQRDPNQIICCDYNHSLQGFHI